MPVFELKGPLQKKIAKQMIHNNHQKEEVIIVGFGKAIVEQLPQGMPCKKGDFSYKGITFRVITKGLAKN